MTQIKIGDRLRRVPREYIQKESEFTRSVEQVFWQLPAGIEKERLRVIILDLRVQLYELYIGGLINLDAKPIPPEKTLWQRLLIMFKS